MSGATLDLPDARATEAVGARLAPNLGSGMLITLSGDLGADAVDRLFSSSDPVR